MHILFQKYNGACHSKIEKLFLRKVSVINEGIEYLETSIVIYLGPNQIPAHKQKLIFYVCNLNKLIDTI